MNIKTHTSFPTLKSTIKKTIIYDTDTFDCEIYPNPYRYISKTNLAAIDKEEVKEDGKIKIRSIDIHDDKYKAIKASILKNRDIQHLLKLFSNNIKDGKPCLDITDYSFINNIVRREYLAYIYIKNKDHNDYAIGALQYTNWCTDDDDDDKAPKQLWIHALCRIQDPQIKKNNPSIKLKSPLSVLFDVVRDFSIKYSITENYLLVDNYAKTGADKLLEIYKNYGFKRDASCNIIPNYEHIEHNDATNQDHKILTSAIVMKKLIIQPGAAAAAANNSMAAATSYHNIAVNMNNSRINNSHINNSHINNSHINNSRMNNSRMNNISGGKRSTRKTKKNKLL